MSALPATDTIHPHLARLAAQRATSIQNRISDAITWFAGSRGFVYLHIAIFGYWVLTSGRPFVNDPFPFGLLTMIVSLEAIFLSAFVMISQNRADARRQVLADHQWMLVQDEEKQNEELLTISKQLLDITQQVHALTSSVHKTVTGVEYTAERDPDSQR